MNTTEVKISYKIKSYSDLYKYAKKQFLMYEKLEGIDDWKEYSFSIDCAKDQSKFKDMLQIRFIEELTEATHAIDNEDHFFEEITDALNFFLSAYIMLDIDFKSLPDPEEYLYNLTKIEKIDRESIVPYFYDIIDDVGDLCNLLKNRPWAQSNYLVSMLDFEKRLLKLWQSFWTMMAKIGMFSSKIFQLFERKYLVNLWRIKTGY